MNNRKPNICRFCPHKAREVLPWPNRRPDQMLLHWKLRLPKTGTIMLSMVPKCGSQIQMYRKYFWWWRTLIRRLWVWFHFQHCIHAYIECFLQFINFNHRVIRELRHSSLIAIRLDSRLAKKRINWVFEHLAHVSCILIVFVCQLRIFLDKLDMDTNTRLVSWMKGVLESVLKWSVWPKAVWMRPYLICWNVNNSNQLFMTSR